MNLTLRAAMVELVADSNLSKRWMSCWLEVLGTIPETVRYLADRCEPRFRSMCGSLMDDIQSAEGSGRDMLNNVTMCESGEVTYIHTGGNAWITYMIPDVVWFEGQYEQTDGEADPVTFRQYKLALETYVRFLADPQHRTIEVPFPDDPTPEIPNVSAIRECLERESIESSRIYRLNTRDREVLDAIRAGMSDREICSTLKLAPERLAQYRAEALEKTRLVSLEEIFEMTDRVEARLAEQAAKAARRR